MKFPRNAPLRDIIPTVAPHVTLMSVFSKVYTFQSHPFNGRLNGARKKAMVIKTEAKMKALTAIRYNIRYNASN